MSWIALLASIVIATGIPAAGEGYALKDGATAAREDYDLEADSPATREHAGDSVAKIKTAADSISLKKNIENSSPQTDTTELIPEPETYYEELPEITITARHRPKGWKERRQWRKQARLVYNFNRVYPFALTGRKLMHQVDSTIEADHLDRKVRDRYIKAVEKELLQLYENDIRNTTISQGFLLTRLVDRECGSSVYDIIKDYEGGFAAGFWNLVGKLFEQDLKSHYDPEGKDKDTEKLVGIWESGDWDEFYFGVFGEYPKKTFIVADHLETLPQLN